MTGAGGGPFDLLAGGGGANGAGIARDAAGRGPSVLSCGKDGLAKLIHGGLRYLECHAFRLVREAPVEREVLLRAAPHTVWPLRFALPHGPEQRPAWMVRFGLPTTSAGGRSCPARASPTRAARRRARRSAPSARSAPAGPNAPLASPTTRRARVLGAPLLPAASGEAAAGAARPALRAAKGG